jgi:hypothetical protein
VEGERKRGRQHDAGAETAEAFPQIDHLRDRLAPNAVISKKGLRPWQSSSRDRNGPNIPDGMRTPDYDER